MSFNFRFWNMNKTLLRENIKAVLKSVNIGAMPTRLMSETESEFTLKNRYDQIYTLRLEFSQEDALCEVIMKHGDASTSAFTAREDFFSFRTHDAMTRKVNLYP